jgi:acetone monooxygenase
MNATLETATAAKQEAVATRLDAVVIGAGIAGLYQLHRLREMGLNVRAYETGSGVGGTWYWNRYPGSRFDSQVEVYQYWFSEELYKSWQPSERFTGQPENERWLNFVADRYDLKKDIQLNTSIVSAHYRDDVGRWDVVTDKGERIDTQFLVACCGMLSAPLEDRFKGQSSFPGEIHHTARWPKGGVDMKGKRVAVVGVGATGIQVVQTIAPEVGSMTVFVRTAPYIVPMRNPKYSKEDWARFGARFHELKKRVRETFAGFDYDFANKPWAECTPEEHTAVLEKFWEDGSLAMWLATFPEMFFVESINEVVSEFVRDKMRKRLHDDPELCRILIPTNYGFGTHRVPLETRFLEAFLQDNVKAVNCRETPIDRVVPEGVMTSDGKVYEADIIILAVGFDAGSGALTRIDIRGLGDRSLKAQWAQEIRTSMGLQVYGYPNLFTTGAPLAPSAALCNMTTCLQQQVDWITDCIAYARDHGKHIVEPTAEFEDRWVRHHDETAAATLVVKTDSWYMGSNVEGKPRRLLSYIGGAGNYHKQCADLAAQGYPGFAMH